MNYFTNMKKWEIFLLIDILNGINEEEKAVCP